MPSSPAADRLSDQEDINMSDEDEVKEELPIVKVKTELMELIKNNQIVVITGDTGSGKSTQLAKFMYEAGYAKEGLIGVTQPRRIGAVSVAKRVAEEMDVELGHTVGYTVRFDDCTGADTKIKFATDGCLLRECLLYKRLEPYSAIILDEAHERSVQTDILFGIVRSISRLRPDLKIVITSATLDVEKFTKYFFNCPSFHVTGRCFPVHIVHEPKTAKYYVESAVTRAITVCIFVYLYICIFVCHVAYVSQMSCSILSLTPLRHHNCSRLELVTQP